MARLVIGQFTRRFAIVGNITQSNIFRDVKPKTEQIEEQLLKGADAWNECLKRDVKQSPMDESMLEACRKEQKSGVLGRFGTKVDMDKRFGRGQKRGKGAAPLTNTANVEQLIIAGKAVQTPRLGSQKRFIQWPPIWQSSFYVS